MQLLRSAVVMASRHSVRTYRQRHHAVARWGAQSVDRRLHRVGVLLLRLLQLPCRGQLGLIGLRHASATAATACIAVVAARESAVAGYNPSASTATAANKHTNTLRPDTPVTRYKDIKMQRHAV